MRLLVLLLVVALGAAGYFAWSERRAVARLATLERRLATADTVASAPPGAETPDTTTGGTLSRWQIESLRGQGLQDPVRDLEASLRSRADLIPVAGTRGGRMQIFAVQILPNARQAWAYYEDGHNGGTMLLQYDVRGGRIDWRVLWSGAL